jgi:hypothetical protein
MKGFIKLSLVFGLSILFIGLMAYLALARNAEANFVISGNPCQTYLTHKETSGWTEFGTKSPLHYRYNIVHLEGHDLLANTDYTLIRYPEPASNPWPVGGWGIEKIVSGTSNGGGELYLEADYTLQQGEKYWLVPTADLLDNNIVTWNPEEILFEHTTDFSSQCLQAPRQEEYKNIDIQINCDNTVNVTVTTNSHRDWRIGDDVHEIGVQGGGVEDNYTWNNISSNFLLEWSNVGKNDWKEADLKSESYTVNEYDAEDCEIPEEPTPTPVVTITRGLTPAGPPPLPECTSPIYAPTVTYLGQEGHTFTYRWTTVRDGLHTYWVNYGSSPDNLPFSVVVQGEEFSITQEADTNWIQVAGYDQGCIGAYSLVTN